MSRRNSFYSGARSRNWERGKTQLLADRIRGKFSQRNLDQSSIQKKGGNFLFKIHADGHPRPDHDGIDGTPVKKILSSELCDEGEEEGDAVLLGEQNCETMSSDICHDDSPAKNTRLSGKTKLERSLSCHTASRTPTKNARRALSLSTPSKRIDFLDQQSTFDVMDQKGSVSPEKISKQNDLTCPNTPKHLRNVAMGDGLSELTPSKRVQFSLTCTPSKEGQGASHFQTPRGKMKSLLGTPATPKSILKTPKKTPNKTPSKRIFFSPDMFSSSKKMVRSPFTTPVKTTVPNSMPKLNDDYDNNLSMGSSFSGFSESHGEIRQTTPVKVENIACYDEGEMELVSPLKKGQDSCKASLILHNTPKKGRYTRNLLDFEPCIQNETEKQNETENEANLDNIVENSLDLDEDVKSSSLLPQMNPEDILLINSLMFGDDFDQNFNISSEVLNTYVDSTSNDFVIDQGICSSPSGYEKDMCEDVKMSSLISLPDKQESPGSQERCEAVLTDGHREHVSLSESVVLSPTSIDKMTSPSLNTLMNAHMPGDIEEDTNIDTQVQPTKDSSIYSGDKDDTSVNYHVEPLCLMEDESYDAEKQCSPEILLDPRFLFRLERAPELKKEHEDSKELSVDSCNKTNGESDDTVDNKDCKITPGRKVSRGSPCKKKFTQAEGDKQNKFGKNDHSNIKVKRGRRRVSSVSSEIKGMTNTSSSDFESVEDESTPNVFRHEENQQQVDGEEIGKGVTHAKEHKANRSRNLKLGCVSSTPVNRKDHKRKISSSETSETDNQENRKFKKRRSLRQRHSPKKTRKSRRMCKKKLTSLKEPSSDDDESLNICQHDSTNVSKKRIFDDDSDFESPAKSKILKIKETLPLKNVENLCKDVVPTNCNITDNSHLHTANEDPGNHSFNTPPRKKEKQQKIDVYLSPVHSREVEPMKALTCPKSVEKRRQNRQSQMPHDWKRIKPRRRLVKDASFVLEKKPLNSSDSGTFSSMNSKKILKNKKRKRKGVKLKLTKSGDNYEVSKVDVSVESSDRNSSTAGSQTLNSEDNISKSPSSFTKSLSPGRKKKKVDSHFLITPLRFTRHMSKDLSVTPELFSQLIALSPEKSSPKSNSDVEESGSSTKKKNHCEIRERKRELVKYFNRKDPRKQDAVVDISADVTSNVEKDVIGSEWTVQNLPGSPTMKTFKRKQKEKYAINSSPRVNLSPISGDQSLLKPSLSSLMHLTVSPIVNKVEPKGARTLQSSRLRTRPKSHRSLYRDEGVD